MVSDSPPLPEIPLPPRPWLTSPEFAEALRTAALMHAAQKRKGSNLPYISHLLGTCSIALKNGATEAEAIAALIAELDRAVTEMETME